MLHAALTDASWAAPCRYEVVLTGGGQVIQTCPADTLSDAEDVLQAFKDLAQHQNVIVTITHDQDWTGFRAGTNSVWRAWINVVSLEG